MTRQILAWFLSAVQLLALITAFPHSSAGQESLKSGAFVGPEARKQAARVMEGAMALKDRPRQTPAPSTPVIGSRQLVLQRGSFDIRVPGSGAATNSLTVGMDCDASLESVSVQGAQPGFIPLFRRSRNLYVTESGAPVPVTMVSLGVRTRGRRDQQCVFTVYDGNAQAPDTPSAGQILYVDINPRSGPEIAGCMGALLRQQPDRLNAAGISSIRNVYSPNGPSPDRGGILCQVDAADASGRARRFYIDLRSRGWQSYSVNIGLPVPGGGMSMSGYRTQSMDRLALLRTGDGAHAALFAFDVGSCWGRP